MAPTKTYKLLHSKVHKQNEKTNYRQGENICKKCHLQRFNVQDMQTAHTIQYQKKNFFLNGQKTQTDISTKTYR